jgi:hypothetical protein
MAYPQSQSHTQSHSLSLTTLEGALQLERALQMEADAKRRVEAEWEKRLELETKVNTPGTTPKRLRMGSVAPPARSACVRGCIFERYYRGVHPNHSLGSPFLRFRSIILPTFISEITPNQRLSIRGVALIGPN